MCIDSSRVTVALDWNDGNCYWDRYDAVKQIRVLTGCSIDVARQALFAAEGDDDSMINRRTLLWAVQWVLLR